MKDAQKKFVLLEGIRNGNRFFTLNDTESDPTRGCTGNAWYRIIGYADTVEEAQIKLYGKEPRQ